MECDNLDRVCEIRDGWNFEDNNDVNSVCELVCEVINGGWNVGSDNDVNTIFEVIIGGLNVGDSNDVNED
ncbi:10436_t:CDS:2 [Gigaspora rosea]|nr:10436_t:CDS:2 [Gigaspora rosea]